MPITQACEDIALAGQLGAIFFGKSAPKMILA